MKKILLILCIFGIMLVSCIPTICADPAIMISSYTVSPEILMPGDIAALTLTVTNGETTATRTTATVEGSTSTTTTKTIGAFLDNIWIVAAQSGNKQIYATLNYPDVGYLAPASHITMPFKLIADDNISEGLYFLTAHIDVESYQDVIYPIPIKVSNATVDAIATSIPSKISMGGTSDVTITLVNNRENSVDKVMVTPTGDDVGFVPASVFIGSLTAGDSQDIVFSIKPLASGTKNLTFDVNYYNGDNLHNTSLETTVDVVETLDVASIVTSFPSSITKGGSARISIEVYNAKTERITGVLVTPISNATVVPSQYFIGAMDPDDVFSASFDIYADTVDFGTHTIGFIVSFKQGNDYYETPAISKSFQVISGVGTSYQNSGGTSSQSAASSGMPQAPSLTVCISTILIIIIVIVAVVIVFIRWRKRRKAK
ncbi:MAG: hypothetical protein NT038_04580 [Euryarchaeota archaeon]|nr:hypothetical protein [Euryarchaeota archaeon]